MTDLFLDEALQLQVLDELAAEEVKEVIAAVGELAMSVIAAVVASTEEAVVTSEDAAAASAEVASDRADEGVV